MFEVGFTEIILIFGIALLVLGPERLPKLAADVGRWAGRARAMARQLRTQLEQEVQFDPLRDTPRSSPPPKAAAAASSPSTPAAATPPADSPPPAATDAAAPAARPDETDESKPA